MRAIHPDYIEAAVSCGCGNTFKTRATAPKLTVEICSNCHPFYTGKQKMIDAAGMVERFQKKWGSTDAQKKVTDHADKISRADVRGRAAERADKILKGEVKFSELDRHFPKPKSNLPPEPRLPSVKPDEPAEPPAT